MRIDLHTHSSVSDGTETPAELLTTAQRAGLDVVALTDHDTTDGWAEAERSRPPGLTVVPGMELSCRWFPDDQPPISVHLLAYLFDPEHPALAAERLRLRAERLARGEKIVAALAADGYPAGLGRDRRGSARRGRGTTARRPRAGRRRSRRVRRRRLRDPAPPPQPLLRGQGRHRGARRNPHGPGGRGSAGVRPRPGPSPRAGPRRRRRGRHGRRRPARSRGRPIPTTSRTSGTTCVAWRDELGLLTTGSSDYHGTNKSTPIGACTTDPGQLEALLERGVGAPVLRD